VKLLVYDGTGLVLIWNRLEGGTFKWPRSATGGERLPHSLLAAPRMLNNTPREARCDRNSDYLHGASGSSSASADLPQIEHLDRSNLLKIHNKYPVYNVFMMHNGERQGRGKTG
jgi:hypothetical protein